MKTSPAKGRCGIFNQAASLAVDREDLEEVPFSQFGGLGRAYELFGDKLNAILEELNGRLAA